MIFNDAVKLRREPKGGLAELRQIIAEDIDNIQNLLNKSAENNLSLQQHNFVLGFLISFICTEMPQVILKNNSNWKS